MIILMHYILDKAGHLKLHGSRQHSFDPALISLTIFQPLGQLDLFGAAQLATGQSLFFRATSTVHFPHTIELAVLLQFLTVHLMIKMGKTS